jgi:hypothetical protein
MFINRYLRYPVQIPNEQNMAPGEVDMRREQLKERGALYYTGMPLVVWFGIYRLYPVKDFINFLVVNYCIELFSQALPLTIITISTLT